MINDIFLKCSSANGTIFGDWPKYTYVFLYISWSYLCLEQYIFIFHGCQFSESRPSHGTQVHCRSRVASTLFKCATASKSATVSSHCTVYWSCEFCGYVKGMLLLFVSFAAFFLFLSWSIQFEILMSVSRNFKGIDIWFSVHCLQSRVLALIFFPPAGCWTWKKLQCWVEFCSPL